MEGEDEAQMVARAAHGEKGAFLAIYEAHHRALYRFAYRLTSSQDVAEDLTQEYFLRLMQQRRFDGTRGSLRLYLCGIVRNLVLQREQGRSRTVHWTDGWEGEPAAGNDSNSDFLVAAELAAAVQAALAALPPLQREAIVLCEFEEFSVDEAAAIVASDPGTVKSRLHRARESLRRRLAPYRHYMQLTPPRRKDE